MQKLTSRQNTFTYVLLAVILAVALFFRLWHINFGLPHSFYADEPEFAEPAIMYTYEIRDIIQNNNYYKLIPVSYVYGTFPVYMLTPVTMFWSKVSNLIGNPVEKMDLYIAMRGFTALLSSLILPLAALTYYKLFKDKKGAVITFLLLALNWKLIVHAHYVNADIILTVLVSASLLTGFYYLKGGKDTLFTVLTGLLFGLSIGTKVTAGITLPLFLYLFISKKDFRGMFAFVFIAFTAFAASNPFSLIFANNFAFRIYSMLTQEAGLVFDSVDTSPFKYVSGLSYILTPIVFAWSIIGVALSLKKSTEKKFNVLLIGHLITYFAFYSIQSRRVDRWLLPAVPILSIYAAYGIHSLLNIKRWRTVAIVLALTTFVWISYYPILLLNQFQRNTPRSAAYIWMRDNLPLLSKKFVITEEGMDPMSKLSFSKLQRAPVYVSENAHLTRPYDPNYFDYIVLSPKPMSYFKTDVVRKEYPYFYEAWNAFEKEVTKSGNYKLIKSFETKEPNLIPLSGIYIYKNNTSTY